MKHKVVSGKELFDLIHSLSKSEKRHFKILASAEKGDKIYIRLFDALNSQKEYDERALLKRSVEGNTGKNFSQAKKYLFDKIIASLHELGIYKNADSQVKDLIETAKLLRYKGLYQQAQNYLELAAKEAVECGILYHRFDINYLAFNFSINTTDADLSPVENTGKLNSEGREILDDVSRYIKVYHVFRTIKAMQVVNPYCRSEEEHTELAEIIRPLLDIKYESLPTAGSKIQYHLTMNCYNSMIGNHFNSMEHVRRVIELVKANPKIDNTIYPHLASYIAAAIKARQLEGLDNYLSEFHEGIKLNPDFHEQKLIFERWLLCSMQLSGCRGDFSEVLQLFRKESSRIKKYSPVTSYIQSQITYHLAVANLFCGDHRTALKLVMQIINEKSTNSDLFLYAKILSILILYEKKEAELLPYYIRSTYRILLKKERVYRSEKLIIDFFRRKRDSANRTALHQDLQQLALQLEACTEDRFEQGLLYYIDIIRWLRSK